MTWTCYHVVGLFYFIRCLFSPPVVEANIIVPREASEHYPYRLNLIPNFYTLYWKYDSANITFEVHVFTKGWIGFGLSPNGAMLGSDIVIGWVKDGVAFMHDRHGVGERTPVIDRRQDWTLLSGEEEGGSTILKFRRPLTLCGPDDIAITDDTVRLIFAHHPVDPDDSSPEVLPHHGFDRRGSRSASLIGRSSDTMETPYGTATYDILNANVQVPENRTSYWCQYRTLPNLPETHHIIKFETILQSGNRNTVHHMLLYYCGHDYDTAVIGTGFWCKGVSPEAGGATSGAYRCSQMLIAWARGGEAFHFPANTGLAIGGKSKPALVMLETHFDNPKRSTFVDNSGMRVWVSPVSRQHEAGVLDVGVSIVGGQLLPPQTERFVSLGHCHETCINKGLEAANVGSISVFGYMLHAHLTGVALRLLQYRNGSLLQVVASDLLYDFNFQETRLLPHQITVEKNDRLVVECVYDTRGRPSVTHGGWAMEDEMCLAFVYYYPRIPLYRCDSAPDVKQYARLLDNVTRTEALSQHESVDIQELAQTIVWTTEKVKRLQSIVTDGEISANCRPNPGAPLSTDQPPWEPAQAVDVCLQRNGVSTAAANRHQMALTVFLVAMLVMGGLR